MERGAPCPVWLGRAWNALACVAWKDMECLAMCGLMSRALARQPQPFLVGFGPVASAFVCGLGLLALALPCGFGLAASAFSSRAWPGEPGEGVQP